MILSIITPIYNRSELFERTLASICPFLSEKIEYIIVSDGSTDIDNVQNLVAKYKKNLNITLHHYPNNAGIGHALNSGISLAKGEWITLIGSDDTFNESALNEITDVLIPRNEKKDFFYYSMIYMDGSKSPSKNPNITNWNLPNYLKYLDSLVQDKYEMGICAKNKIFDTLKFPEFWAYEDRFHLRLNRDFQGGYESYPAKLIFQDASERASIPNMRRYSTISIRKYIYQAEEFRSVLKEFGKLLHIYAPTYRRLLIRKILAREFIIIRHPFVSINQMDMQKYLFTVLKIPILMCYYFLSEIY